MSCLPHTALQAEFVEIPVPSNHRRVCACLCLPQTSLSKLMLSHEYWITAQTIRCSLQRCGRYVAYSGNSSYLAASSRLAVSTFSSLSSDAVFAFKSLRLPKEVLYLFFAVAVFSSSLGGHLLCWGRVVTGAIETWNWIQEVQSNDHKVNRAQVQIKILR